MRQHKSKNIFLFFPQAHIFNAADCRAAAPSQTGVYMARERHMSGAVTTRKALAR